MKINDSSGRLGIVQDARFLCNLDVDETSSYTIYNIIRNVNARAKEVNSLIWRASSTWEYDDRNQTNLPIATTTLVAEQQDYEMPTDLHKIIRLEIKDDSGDWHLLDQFDQSQIKSEALTEYLEDSGLPEFYDIIGRSLFLYPKPSATDVSLANGLKVYFSRDIKEFTVTDTNTEPGFIDNFHRYLSLGAAVDWLTAKSLDSKQLRADLEIMKQEILTFYGLRNAMAKKIRINPSGEGVLDSI